MSVECLKIKLTSVVGNISAHPQLKEGRENYRNQKARAKRDVFEDCAKSEGRAKCFTH